MAGQKRRDDAIVVPDIFTALDAAIENWPNLADQRAFEREVRHSLLAPFGRLVPSRRKTRGAGALAQRVGALPAHPDAARRDPDGRAKR